MPSRDHPIRVPDLDLGKTPIVVSAWLVAAGKEVMAGDRVVELWAGDVTVDLPAPVSGILARRLVAEDSQVQVGEVLGVVAEGD